MSSIDNRIPVGVVVQTHWDREWYLPHQSFIARLLQVMERVADQLEDGSLHGFLFDGQTAALEDLLAHAEPALARRISRLAADGRIALGPWYVMADQALCSGEALLRNLETGIADALRAGNCQRVGYLPDTFGHIAQMPQILRNFGIGSAVLWRGIDHPHAEFDWMAPDGSTVGAIFLTQGYYQHPLNLPGWQAALDTYLEQVAGRSLAPQLLLTQGGDHLAPHAGLAQRIETFNASQDRYRLKQDTLEDHVAKALAGSAGRRAAVEGELRQNAQVFVLPDVLSTRRYLKRLNQRIEDRLLGETEALYAQLAMDGEHPAAYLDATWRMLLQQHAHDSICGCSVDAVHDEMVTRYTQLGQRLDALRERACAAAGMIALAAADGDPFADDARFTLFNPLPQPLDGWHEVSLFLKGAAAGALAIAGPGGQPLEHVLLEVAPAGSLRSPLDDFPDMLDGHRYTVAIRAALPGLAALDCGAATASAPGATAPAAATWIENDSLRIDFEDGALVWTDKASGAARRDPLVLLSELDAGDSYNFSPPPCQARSLLDRFRLEEVRHLGGVQEMRLALALALPAGLDPKRAGPSPERVVNRGVLRLRLYQGQAGLDCRLDWDNAARDQRTRLLFPLDGPVDQACSDGGFHWQRRPVTLADYPATPSRREMPVAVHPSWSVVAAGALAVAHRGLQEYEIVDLDGRLCLGLTLVRSVGWLSRRDLVTRGVGAGPDLEVPGAQCLGPDHAEFRLAPAAPDDAPAALALARALRQPAVLLRGHGAWRPAFDVGDSRLQVGALRRIGAEDELRLWNPCAAPLRADGLAGWRRVRADGTPAEGGLEVGPHAIATFRRPR